MLKNLVVYVSDLEIKLHVPPSAARQVLRCHGWVIRITSAFSSMDHAKRSSTVQQMLFFGKVGRVANEDVVLQLLSSKYLPNVWFGSMLTCEIRFIVS